MGKHQRKVQRALKARQDGLTPKGGFHMPGSLNAHKTGKRGNGSGR